MEMPSVYDRLGSRTSSSPGSESLASVPTVPHRSRLRPMSGGGDQVPHDEGGALECSKSADTGRGSRAMCSPSVVRFSFDHHVASSCLCALCIALLLSG